MPLYACTDGVMRCIYVSCPVLKRTLFDALVRPILSYCCEIWVILGGKGAMHKLEQVYIQFLRQLIPLREYLQKCSSCLGRTRQCHIACRTENL